MDVPWLLWSLHSCLQEKRWINQPTCSRHLTWAPISLRACDSGDGLPTPLYWTRVGSEMAEGQTRQGFRGALAAAKAKPSIVAVLDETLSPRANFIWTGWGYGSWTGPAGM